MDLESRLYIKMKDNDFIPLLLFGFLFVCFIDLLLARKCLKKVMFEKKEKYRS